MAEPIRLVVWTLSERLLDADHIEWVHLSLAEERAVTVWPGHAPMLAETAADALAYQDGTGRHTIDLPAGIVHVEGDTVTVFLVGTLDDQAWQSESPRPFDRLAQAMVAALKDEQLLPGEPEPERQ